MDIFKNELTILWEVVCPRCGSEILNKNGKYRGRQRFICLDCGLSFTTYSRSILDSTKLTPKHWEIIIESIINNEKLESISKKTSISCLAEFEQDKPKNPQRKIFLPAVPSFFPCFQRVLIIRMFQ